jgi:membrane-associated phospholipid phosphatase
MIARIPLGYPVAAAAGFLALFAMVATGWAPLDRLDSAISESARRYGEANMDGIRVQRVITDTASTGIFFAAGLSGAVVLLLLRRAYAGAALIAAVFVAVPAVWGTFHALLHRPRPADGFVEISSNGFPSGHAANSAAAALVCVLLIWPHATRRGRTIAACVAAAFVLLIGATRVTLLAHWPSDVVGAWLLVLAVVPLVARAVERVGRRDRENYVGS